MIWAWLLACGGPGLTAEVDPATGVATVTATAGEATLHRADGAEVAGRRSEDGRVFVTAGPLKRGVDYVARAGGASRTVVREAVASGPAPTVAVHPDVDRVPSNHLKFYVHFSRPMQQPPDLFSRIALVDETLDEPVDGAFYELANWDRDGRSLTLLLHPGRQKRGIGFGEGLAPVLEEGHTYALRVSAGLRATDGAVVADDVVHRFEVGPADRVSPNAGAWSAVPAPAGGVEVRLDEAAEPRLLASAFAVRTLEGAALQALAEVQPGARAVVLRPASPWPGTVEVVQVAPVEDLAGNTPGRTFDHAVGERDDATPFRARVSVEPGDG